MADDMIPQEADETLDQVVDTIVEVEDNEQLAAEVEPFDERVEAAVRHVAEEAEADAQAAQEEVAAAVESPVIEAEEEQAVAEPERKKRERRSKQARAAKSDGLEAAAAAPAAAPAAPKAKLGMGAWIAICCASLLAGLAIGHFALGGAAGSSLHLSDMTNVEASQLESTYATYTYNGKTEAITVQEVIDGSGNASQYENEDGTYKLPSAEVALSVARNKIVQSEMDSRGITATDEDLEAFAQEQLGMTEFDAIASAYGIDVDTLKEQLTSAYRLKLLREEVIDVELPTQPTQPTAPEEGKEEEATEEYATYILDLAGDEWNSKKQKWVDETSPYATALADYDIKNDSATYAAAQDAYYVAYQNYATAQSDYNDQWTAFVNGLMINASIEVGTLVM